MDKIRIGILGYNGVAAINVVGPLEAFSNAFLPPAVGPLGQTAAPLQQTPCYEVVIIGCGAEQFVADSGVTFHAQLSDSGELGLDTLIVPGGRGLRSEETAQQVAGWIKTHAQQIRRVASVCTGIYGLAPTGLLDGHRVTTHWQNAMDVAARFPKLQVEESALVLKDGKFYTAAGATAGIDLALFLIAEDFGREVAVTVARQLLVYLRRDGGQEQYSEPARPAATNGSSNGHQLNTDRMKKLVTWIGKHLGEDLRLDILARHALLSKNDFIQEFTGTFGISPGLFVKNLRFNEARRRLMSGQNATVIARSLGFADPAYFIQEFRRRFGVLPNDYQRRFGSAVADPELEPLGAFDQLELAAAGPRAKPARRPRITSFTRCIRRHT